MQYAPTLGIVFLLIFVPYIVGAKDFSPLHFNVRFYCTGDPEQSEQVKQLQFALFSVFCVGAKHFLPFFVFPA